jgi:hypothetical protein
MNRPNAMTIIPASFSTIGIIPETIPPKIEVTAPMAIKLRLKPRTMSNGRYLWSSFVPETIIGTTGRTHGDAMLVKPAVILIKTVANVISNGIIDFRSYEWIE